MSTGLLGISYRPAGFGLNGLDLNHMMPEYLTSLYCAITRQWLESYELCSTEITRIVRGEFLFGFCPSVLTVELAGC